MAQPYNFDPYTGQPLRQPREWSAGYPSQLPQRPPQPVQNTGGVNTQPGVVCRPVASYDEAKAVPTDFSGALTIMPDWAHGHIYVKALADNGSPVFRSYREEPPMEAAAPTGGQQYAPLSEIQRLEQEIADLRQALETSAPAPAVPEKAPGKGGKS